MITTTAETVKPDGQDSDYDSLFLSKTPFDFSEVNHADPVVNPVLCFLPSSTNCDFRLSLVENSTYNGILLWKIPEFRQRMDDAKDGKYTSTFSPPFYTSRCGYKMCIRAYLNGDGIGKGSHMSVFFVVMKGDFDNTLEWPFKHRVTFKLINQSSGRRDVVDTFQPDPTNISFQKPKLDMNVASGCPRFVNHTDLENGFVVDDTVLIQCTVDTNAVDTSLLVY